MTSQKIKKKKKLSKGYLEDDEIQSGGQKEHPAAKNVNYISGTSKLYKCTNTTLQSVQLQKTENKKQKYENTLAQQNKCTEESKNDIRNK